ncbi:hypothetical protein EW146_g10468 [Bondarzewia mesenterica]|uniref:HNH nuclease domain-containing protein n=1 Tax=Bondarzewia mesenterica TaxID=1095465 RepID=A0A4S4KX20_9AGAM|nr:hypothetical protein EW146_g10468 [Bondarzewia mesenterica]
MAEENAGTCLVTGAKARVRPYHLLQRCHWTNHPLLSRLEWSWGLKYDTIELDTSQNTVFLRHDLWELFASGKITLMPSVDIIDKLWARWEKLDLKSEFIQPIDEIYDGKDSFEYRLLPLMANVPAITRPSDNSEDNAATVYSYPFDEMPVVISCVKPHFIVQAAGEIIDGMVWNEKRSVGLAVSRIYGTSDLSAMDAVDTIVQSYLSWVFQSPPNHFACHPRIACPRIFDTTLDEPLRSPSLQPASGPIKSIRRSTSPAPYPHVSGHLTGGDGSSGPDLEGSREQVILRHTHTVSPYEEEALEDLDDWVDFCAQTAALHGWESVVVNDNDVRDYD